MLDATLSPEEHALLKQSPLKLNSAGFDPWGLDPNYVKVALRMLKWLYTGYFRVETHGIEKVPQGGMLLASNHGGQIPIDGLLLALAMALDAKPPRIVRGMVERFVPSMPFISGLFNRLGQVTGDPRVAKDLLVQGECVMVFPEGVRGSGKTIFRRYELQRFGTGFVRLALETKKPIVPVAIIGCEESYPGITNLATLAKLLRTPYFPVTPFFPFLGPLGAVPLPTKVTIRFADPIQFDADPEVTDREVERMVKQVRLAIQSELDLGLQKRGKKIFTGSGK